MEDLPELYSLETVEQMRAIADELRQRIYVALAERSMTATQVGEHLGIAPAKAHYHVRELERVRLVRLVETREKGGILEKYYRPVARSVNVPRSLLERMSPDDIVSTMSEFIQDIQGAFMRAVTRKVGTEEGPKNLSLTRSHYWLTDEEYPAVLRAIERALEPYSRPRGIEGEKERTFVNIVYETEAAAEPRSDRTNPSTERRRTIVAGGVRLDRAGLEKMRDNGQTLDMTVLGLVSITRDVNPDLVDQVIVRFRHRGVLNASDAVRAVLKRKAAESSSDRV